MCCVLAFPSYLLSKLCLDCLKKQTLKNADGCKLIFLKGSKPFAMWLEFPFDVYPKTPFSCYGASWPAGSTPLVWQPVLPSRCLKSPRKLSSKRQWHLAVPFFAFHGLHFSFLLGASCLRINSQPFLSVRHLLPWLIKALYIFCVDLVNNVQMQLWSLMFMLLVKVESAFISAWNRTYACIYRDIHISIGMHMSQQLCDFLCVPAQGKEFFCQLSQHWG